MRGASSDALRGATFKDSSFAAPADRLYNDNAVIRPMAHMDTGTSDKHFDLARRRTFPIQTTNYPMIPAYSPDGRKPSALTNNGFAPLPNAGIYRKQSTLVIGGVTIG